MTAAALVYGWGQRACRIYLWISLPMLPFLFFRFDLAVVALAAWGVALGIRGEQRAGGVTLGAAVMTKLWPWVLIPTVLSERRRTFVWAVASTLVGIVTWILVSSVDGPSQVGSFRGAVGWDVSSVVGSAVWAIAGDHPNMESGVERVGFVAPWELALLFGSLAVLLWLIYRSAWRGNWDLGGAPALAAVVALLVCSPVFGLQYGAWLLPWTAVAASSQHPEERRLAAFSVAVIVLTGVQAVGIILGIGGFAPTAVRNVICVLIPILWLAWAFPSPGARRSSVPLSAS
jgi:Glycosyltransferase family 87